MVSPISNPDSTKCFSLANICYDYSFNWQTEKKKLFGAIENVFSFSRIHIEKNLCKKIVKEIGEKL
jgi:hypothetical protein